MVLNNLEILKFLCVWRHWIYFKIWFKIRNVILFPCFGMNVWWRMYALKLVQLLLYGSCVNHWYMLLLSVRVEEIISRSLRVKGFMRKGLSVCDRSFWVVTITSPSATCSWILRRLSVAIKNWLLDVCFILNPLVQCLIWEPNFLVLHNEFGSKSFENASLSKFSLFPWEAW